MTNFLLPLIIAATTAAPQQIIDPNFHTLKVEVAGDFMAPPIIALDSPQQICFSFDDMDPGRKYLRYSLTHCDADWQPSDIVESEFLDSFNEAEIYDYGFSAGVFRNYVNYRICIPNGDMKPLISGNYLLSVYYEDDPEEPILYARFAVSEQRVAFSGNVTSLTDRGYNDKWQQLNFNIDLGHYQVNDPYNELTVKIEQNGIDVTPAGLRPLRVNGNTLIYEHNRDLIFPAGNEFRRFETVRTDFEGMHIASNSYDGDGYTATLTEDSERVSRPYTYDRTQFGRFKVDDYNSSDPDLGADYVNTIFTLDYPLQQDKLIVLDGEFVRSLPLEQRTLHYDYDSGKYTTSLLLKQGSYNYRYAVLPKGSTVIDSSPIEGDKYETNNEFTIKVYHRPPGSRYTRLIGTATLHTNP
ncbi:MAG: DUF5103 domain-containing protein [Muribaculaceae bacterium]|nr:DUF5103 domain-containing protein [Muribaculaceae bacterium]